MINTLMARIGYMKFYQGPKPGDDKPIGGGKYNLDEVGHEAFNYLPVDGKMYGYFQPHMIDPYHINLSRIDPLFGDNDDEDEDEDKKCLRNVLVIWFATDPVAGGQVVIGWFNNATVYEAIQSTNNTQPQRNNYHYNVVADEKDCVLLPISSRKYVVGHALTKTRVGNPGTANVFYFYDEKGNYRNVRSANYSWIMGLLTYVNSYKGLELSSDEDRIQEDILTAQHDQGGCVVQSDVEVRLMIESYAMTTCYDYYEKLGYEIVDVSHSRPYDFEISKKGSLCLVEVKGTQSTGDKIILTKNEVALHQNNSNIILFIVHSIVLNKKKLKNRIDGQRFYKLIVDKSSGINFIVDPWTIDAEWLTPIAYTYMPKSAHKPLSKRTNTAAKRVAGKELNEKLNADKEYQINNIERIFNDAAFSPIFKSNPKYPVNGVARIAYGDVMDRKCIIRYDEDFSDNSCWSKNTEIIVKYGNVKDLVDDGWRLD